MYRSWRLGKEFRLSTLKGRKNEISTSSYLANLQQEEMNKKTAERKLFLEQSVNWNDFTESLEKTASYHCVKSLYFHQDAKWYGSTCDGFKNSYEQFHDSAWNNSSHAEMNQPLHATRLWSHIHKYSTFSPWAKNCFCFIFLPFPIMSHLTPILIVE